MSDAVAERHTGKLASGNHVELRQLRYFLTLAEELHFGRAAAREHIVQSALSQQIQRLERALGVTLVERTTHYVRLTRAGEALVAEAPTVLRAVDRAVAAAQTAGADTEVLAVAVGDSSLDSMPQVLRNVQYNHPGLVVHRLEATVTAQYRMLAEGSLDVGFGNAANAPPGVVSELIRLDPLGVLVREGNPIAGADSTVLAALAGVPLVLADDSQAPEFNAFLVAACEAAGFEPRRYHGTVQSIRAAAYLVAEDDCAAVVPRSCDLLMPGLRWVQFSPPILYPWFLLSRSGDSRWAVRSVHESAHGLAAKLGWLAGDQPI
ncbi:LysR family transcriptional regulator [Flexivirga alba]|uniref:LysR family transcriptional regulator n=1 Tax=Flexivirga alba TaxID=702742 RepID=A0ABW2ACI0_9MICO